MSINRARLFALTLTACLLLQTVTASHAADVAHTQTFTIGPMAIDKPYMSMTGPIKTERVHLGAETQTPELWVTKFKVATTDNNGAPLSSEFLCHAGIYLGEKTVANEGLLTISQGLDEMVLPEGFAMRVANTPNNALIMAQVLNNNGVVGKVANYQLTVTYVDAAEAAAQKLRPLREVRVAVLAKDAMPDVPTDELCLPDEKTMGKSMSPAREGFIHFNVPPGKHEYKTALEKDHPIYHGGTVHYIKLHLHPYGESITLMDTTTKTPVWKGHVDNATGRRALTDVDYYSSTEGIKIDPTHKYEIISIYNNTTPKAVDAMAVLRLYLAD